MRTFVGYASERGEVAEEIKAFLEKLGHEVWFDKNSIIGGLEWDQARLTGQSEANLIVHLLSREILSRRGVVNREIRDSLELYRDEPLGSLFIVPIRLEPITLPLELSRFEYIDYFEPQWRGRLRETVLERQAQLAKYPNLLPPAEKLAVRDLTAGQHQIVLSDSTTTYDCLGSYIEYLSESRFGGSSTRR